MPSDYAIATWGRWHRCKTLPQGLGTTVGAVRSWHALCGNWTIAFDGVAIGLTSLSMAFELSLLVQERSELQHFRVVQTCGHQLTRLSQHGACFRIVV